MDDQQQEERTFDDDIPYTIATTPGERIMTQMTLLTAQMTQLRQEAAIKRLPASEACKELMDHCQKYEQTDALVTGILQSDNPFKETKTCNIL